ncbi:hypothetical protein HPB50_009894 [Hyalomma asiaticum]|uniref:Uncharacterized protein n=1 Tax=Hyalomma asiaticum TaxID=266040 RepID=A0ACB7RJ46_HYAAI|nr:hypothetical protein HPB50_009894 [Hyalomma asiaticum]
MATCRPLGDTMQILLSPPIHEAVSHGAHPIRATRLALSRQLAAARFVTDHAPPSCLSRLPGLSLSTACKGLCVLELRASRNS